MLRTTICAFAILACATSTQVFTGDDDVIHIIFDESDEQDTRSSSIFPLSGFVDTAVNLVNLTFASPCGTVLFRLEKLDENSYMSGTVAGMGSVMIPFSCSADQWRITLTFSSGTVYIGEFTIYQTNNS